MRQVENFRAFSQLQNLLSEFVKCLPALYLFSSLNPLQDCMLSLNKKATDHFLPFKILEGLIFNSRQNILDDSS